MTILEIIILLPLGALLHSILGNMKIFTPKPYKRAPKEEADDGYTPWSTYINMHKVK